MAQNVCRSDCFNMFSRAKTKEQVLAFVANLTNSILPEQDSINWESAARKALVQHALIAGNKNAVGVR